MYLGVAKKIKDDDGTWEKTIYYIRDAQGNVMCVYEYTEPEETASLMLKEEHIYGSSRLGMRADTLEMIGADPVLDTLKFALERGMKRYELSNHLGNVLSVISDQKIPVEVSSAFDHYVAEVMSYSDYYPFGAPMNERTWSSGDYRYGFQEQEIDVEFFGSGNAVNFTHRTYDCRVGRFFAPDPLLRDFPFISPYTFAHNLVLGMNELEGLQPGNSRRAYATNARLSQRSKHEFQRRETYRLNAENVSRARSQLMELQNTLSRNGIVEMDFAAGMIPKSTTQQGAGINYGLEVIRIWAQALDWGLEIQKVYNFGSGAKDTPAQYSSHSKSPVGNDLFQIGLIKLEFEYQKEFKKEYDKAFQGDMSEEQIQNMTEDELSQRRMEATFSAKRKVGFESPMKIAQRIMEKMISDKTVEAVSVETVSIPTLNPAP